MNPESMETGQGKKTRDNKTKPEAIPRNVKAYRPLFSESAKALNLYKTNRNHSDKNNWSRGWFRQGIQ